MDLVTVTFDEWWQRPENQQGFWRTTYASNGDRVAVSLGETPRKIFRQILQLLKCWYHDRNVGYGNLLEGVHIDVNNQVVRFLEGPNPNINPGEPLASIRQDFLDFERLVTRVEGLIKRVQGVKPAYSSRKFHELCRLLDYNYYNSEDGLRRFGFYMRNNPLFLDEAAKFLFFRKVLTIKEFDYRFSTSVKLQEIQDWSQDVRHNRLKAVRDYNGNRNQSKYMKPDGSILFYRNCLGHIRSWNARYDDAQILRALEDDLPHVIPVWFYALVRQLDFDYPKCSQMCGYSWMEFLSMQPSVFT